MSSVKQDCLFKRQTIIIFIGSTNMNFTKYCLCSLVSHLYLWVYKDKESSSLENMIFFCKWETNLSLKSNDMEEVRLGKKWSSVQRFLTKSYFTVFTFHDPIFVLPSIFYAFQHSFDSSNLDYIPIS